MKRLKPHMQAKTIKRGYEEDIFYNGTKMLKKGLVQVCTWNGKGKTTAAIGPAIRTNGRELNVYIIQLIIQKN